MAFRNTSDWIAKKDANLLVSLFLLIISVGVSIKAYLLGLGKLHSPGPGLTIFGASSILGLLALHLFIKYLVTQGLSGKNTWVGIYWKRAISVAIALVVYAVLLNSVGYLLLTFLFLILLFRTLRGRGGNWGWIIGGAALTSFATYLIFSLMFELYFPKGLISFF